jgi:hypothetical protein
MMDPGFRVNDPQLNSPPNDAIAFYQRASLVEFLLFTQVILIGRSAFCMNVV